MDQLIMDEPGPVLQHHTGLERDHSEAANVQKTEYYKTEREQDPVAEGQREAPEFVNRQTRIDQLLPLVVPPLVFHAIETALEGGYDAAHDFAARLRTFLPKRSLRRLLWATWCALGDEDAEEIAEAILGGAGAPIPPFQEIQVLAGIWAECASRKELEAYGRAALAALPPGRRANLVSSLGEGRA